jgi:hypothetical protein
VTGEKRDPAVELLQAQAAALLEGFQREAERTLAIAERLSEAAGRWLEEQRPLFDALRKPGEMRLPRR